MSNPSPEPSAESLAEGRVQVAGRWYRRDQAFYRYEGARPVAIVGYELEAE